MQRLLLQVLSLIITVCCTKLPVSRFPVQSATYNDPEHLHPVIRDFQSLIENDAEIWLGFHQMFDEIPDTQEYFMDPSGLRPQVDVCQTILDRYTDRGWPGSKL